MELQTSPVMASRSLKLVEPKFSVGEFVAFGFCGDDWGRAACVTNLIFVPRTLARYDVRRRTTNPGALPVKEGNRNNLAMADDRQQFQGSSSSFDIAI